MIVRVNHRNIFKKEPKAHKRIIVCYEENDTSIRVNNSTNLDLTTHKGVDSTMQKEKQINKNVFPG